MFLIYNEIITLTLISFLVALLSNLVLYFTIDKHKMAAFKERAEKLRKKMQSKDVKENPEKFKELMDEQMSMMREHFSMNMKSMVINLIFILPFYYYLVHALNGYSFKLPFEMLFLGNEIGWIWLYIFYVILFSVVIKKLLKLNY